MSEQIIKILEYMGDKIGVAIDWTQENVMPYVEDLVRRFITLNIVECVLGIVLFLGFSGVAAIMWGLFKKGRDKALKTHSDNAIVAVFSDGSYIPDIGGALLIAGMVVTILISVSGIAINISELVKWIIVPELQIIEEVAYLIN